LTLAVVVCLLILLTDVRSAIGFSSFCVLLYYLVANLAAYRQHRAHRRFPRPLQLVGALGCTLLVAMLPWQSIVTGVAILAVGIACRGVSLRLSRRQGTWRGPYRPRCRHNRLGHDLQHLTRSRYDWPSRARAPQEPPPLPMPH